MLRKSFYLLLLSLLFCAQKCKEEEKQLTEYFFQKWYASFEEDRPSFRVFRNEDFDFPLVRARTGMAFSKDGIWTEYTYGSTDKPEERQGKWEYTEGVLTTTSSQNIVTQYRVIELDSSYLKLKILK